jgi:hypothetical protein
MEGVTMTKLAIAIGVLAIGLAAAVPARADFAVVRFKDHSCRAWAEHKAAPTGKDWKYLWVSVPSWEAAQGKGGWAMKHHWCKAWYK